MLRSSVPNSKAKTCESLKLVGVSDSRHVSITFTSTPRQGHINNPTRRRGNYGRARTMQCVGSPRRETSTTWSRRADRTSSSSGPTAALPRTISNSKESLDVTSGARTSVAATLASWPSASAARRRRSRCSTTQLIGLPPGSRRGAGCGRG